MPSETKITLDGWRPSSRKPPSSSANVKPDQQAGRQHEQDRGDAEIAGDQRHAISGGAEEHGLPETHDAGVAPDQIEREREQAEDQHPRRIDRQIVLQHQRQQRADHQHDDFDDRQHLPSARAAGTKRKPQRRRLCRFCHQVASIRSRVRSGGSPPLQRQLRASRSAFLGIDEAGAARDDLVVAALGDRRVHLHLAVPLAGNHFGRPAGTFGDLGMIERRGDRVAIDLAGLLDRGFPQFEAAIGAGRGASGGEQERARELLFIGRLDLGAERILRRQRLEIVEAAREPLDLARPD